MLASLHKRIPKLFALITAFCLVSPASGEDTLTLNFGVYSTDNATLVVRKYMPALKMLEHSLSAKLDRTVDIRMHIAKTQKQAAQQLQEGYVDFASLSSDSYLESKSLNPKLRILAAENAMDSTVLTPWVARSGMHERDFHALRESMFGLKNTKVLTSLKAFGFVQSHDSQYATLRSQFKFTTTGSYDAFLNVKNANSVDAVSKEPALLGAYEAGIRDERINRTKFIDRKQIQ